MKNTWKNWKMKRNKKMTKLQLKFMLLVVWYIKGKSVPKTERHSFALQLKDEIQKELDKKE